MLPRDHDGCADHIGGALGLVGMSALCVSSIKCKSCFLR
jgi:hypothetical protein